MCLKRFYIFFNNYFKKNKLYFIVNAFFDSIKFGD